MYIVPVSLNHLVNHKMYGKCTAHTICQHPCLQHLFETFFTPINILQVATAMTADICIQSVRHFCPISAKLKRLHKYLLLFNNNPFSSSRALTCVKNNRKGDLVGTSQGRENARHLWSAENTSIGDRAKMRP